MSVLSDKSYYVSISSITVSFTKYLICILNYTLKINYSPFTKSFSSNLNIIIYFIIFSNSLSMEETFQPYMYM